MVRASGLPAEASGRRRVTPPPSSKALRQDRPEPGTDLVRRGV
jgi:hypothetical protein